MKKLNIICFAGNLYDQKPWTNRQNVMTRWARNGTIVLYIEPPKSMFLQFLKLFFKREQKSHKWFFRLFKPEQREKNLFIFSLIKFLPTKSKLLRTINHWLNRIFIKQVIKKLRLNGYILWLYSPEYVDFTKWLKADLVIYDCVDEYAAQPYYQKQFKGLKGDELELLRRAHCVFTSAPYLYDNKKLFNQNTYFLPNAADFAHFNRGEDDISIPEDIKNISKPIIGFIGAIDRYKLDFDMVLYLSRKRPVWSFVLIGEFGVAEKVGDASVLIERENIYLLGKKDYKILPNYIKAFDVAIIPYVENEYTQGCFPIKFFEYLATGKPVVVSGLPALKKYKDIIGYAENKEEFLRLIEKSLREDPLEIKKKRINIAERNTWEKKVERQRQIIEEYLKNENRD